MNAITIIQIGENPVEAGVVTIFNHVPNTGIPKSVSPKIQGIAGIKSNSNAGATPFLDFINFFNLTTSTQIISQYQLSIYLKVFLEVFS